VPSYETQRPEIISGLNIGSSKRTVENNTVLLCKINPHINRVWTVKSSSEMPKLASTEWIPFFPCVDVYPDYLRYYLMQSAFREYLMQNVSGVGGSLMRVRPAAVDSYPFPLPPLPDQRAIVAAIETQFTQLDAAVAALKRVRANLRRYRAAVLQAACAGRLVPTEAELARAAGRGYEPAAALLARMLAERRAQWQAEHPGKQYKEPAGPDTSALPELPEGWCWATVGQLFSVQVGSTPSRQNAQFWNGDIPWVSSGEVAFKRINDTKETISHEGWVNSSVKVNPPGTVLLAMIGEGKTRGQAAILNISAANNQNVAAICVSQTYIAPEWVYYWFMASYETTRRAGSGGMQYALNSERVRSIAIPLAPINEMHRIVADLELRLSNIDFVENNTICLSMSRAARLRQSILQRAFRGELTEGIPDTMLAQLAFDLNSQD
jgi:type I restriction enzyme S subunit